MEYSDRGRTASVFPRRWGTPPTDDAQALQTWIALRCKAEMVGKAGRNHAARLAHLATRRLDPSQQAGAM